MLAFDTESTKPKKTYGKSSKKKTVKEKKAKPKPAKKTGQKRKRKHNPPPRKKKKQVVEDEKSESSEGEQEQVVEQIIEQHESTIEQDSEPPQLQPIPVEDLQYDRHEQDQKLMRVIRNLETAYPSLTLKQINSMIIKDLLKMSDEDTIYFGTRLMDRTYILDHLVNKIYEVLNSEPLSGQMV